MKKRKISRINGKKVARVDGKKVSTNGSGQKGGGVFYDPPSIVKRWLPVHMAISPKKKGGHN